MFKSLMTVALLSTSLSVAIVRADDVTGTWIEEPSQIRPDVVTSRLEIERRKGHLTGAFKGWLGQPLMDLKREGETISFRTSPFGPQSPFVRWSGTLQGDELRMSTQYSETEPAAIKVFRRASPQELAQIRDEPIVAFERQPLPRLKALGDDGLARTPPMGVGTWVFPPSDAAVRTAADQMVSLGLRDAGYTYLLLDAGWQGRRDAQGVLHPNGKFPDMKALVDYVHSKGLKFGLYSSPGPLDGVGAIGSHGHEEQDAKTFAKWGIDYLKYDWTSANQIYRTQAEMQALYQKMGESLRATGRPILYSLCQYGWFDVGQWGRKVGAHGWRTSWDIEDNWRSMSENGFERNGNPEHAGPGGWNDPDNLQIGKGGMTAEEYRTQMTLWSIMAAPLIIELRDNNLAALGPENKKILLNREVIAVDQDALGKQGRPVKRSGTSEVWAKPLSDGSMAIGLFNRGEQETPIQIRWSELALGDSLHVRDLWKQSDLGVLKSGFEATVLAHGTVLIKVRDTR